MPEHRGILGSWNKTDSKVGAKFQKHRITQLFRRPGPDLSPKRETSLTPSGKASACSANLPLICHRVPLFCPAPLTVAAVTAPPLSWAPLWLAASGRGVAPFHLRFHSAPQTYLKHSLRAICHPVGSELGGHASTLFTNFNLLAAHQRDIRWLHTTIGHQTGWHCHPKWIEYARCNFILPSDLKGRTWRYCS